MIRVYLRASEPPRHQQTAPYAHSSAKLGDTTQSWITSVIHHFQSGTAVYSRSGGRPQTRLGPLTESECRGRSASRTRVRISSRICRGDCGLTW